MYYSNFRARGPPLNIDQLQRFFAPIFYFIIRIEWKGARTVDVGVPSSIVSKARIECEDSTLGGVPATRYVLRPPLVKGRIAV